ncbi:DedA family protein [Thermopolyspora sp. NPDC052614]|uniref:DedA family protein n=1 Tax=Thermopolyspora sp. NPDC052614 TaxID=3155682 RepID=UPI00342070B3
MSQAILDFLEQAITSPWVYAAIALVAAVDAFFPVVPSETAVITAGVFAASTGVPNVPLVIAAATVGAFAGDHVAYLLGRSSIGRLRDRRGARPVFDWAGRALRERGGLVLVIARYIPGARTATTVTAGAVGYSRRRFAFFDAIAATSWGCYATMIGYVGGAAFEQDPLGGLLLGFCIAIGVTVVVEVVRYVRRRRAGGEAAGSGAGAEFAAEP